MKEYYCRIIPLRKVIKDPDIINRIEILVLETNLIIRETYQFTRLYFIDKLKESYSYPLINESFLKFVVSLVCNRLKKHPIKNLSNELQTELEMFYNEHYKDLQIQKINSVGKDLLHSEIIKIITNVENHIKGTFFSYVKRLAWIICPDKEEYKKVLNDLFDNPDTLKSDPQYHERIQLFAPRIKESLETLSLWKNPQSCLKLMFDISVFIEEGEGKMFSLFPLRRSFIPSYISISETIFKNSFKEIIKEKNPHNLLDLWSDIEKDLPKKLKPKERFHFKSLETNGIGCSVRFDSDYSIKKKEKTAFEYLQDIENVQSLLRDKKLVGIDPNKGNLAYCNDGEIILRYTQNERRFVTRKIKYKKIRNNIIYDCILESSDKTLHMVKDDEKILREFSPKTTIVKKFKEYIKLKNIMARRYFEIYKEPILRKLRFNTKVNSKRSEDNFVNKFKNTYGEKAVIAFGDWEERPGFLRGKEPTKGKSLRMMFKKAGYQVYLIDEYRTSKTCCKCHGENDYSWFSRKDPRPWKKGEYQKVWGLSRCKNKSCGMIHNRDKNSSKNILEIAKTIVSTGDLPEVFRRQHQQTNVISEINIEEISFD